MEPVENVTVAGKHGKLCRGSANQVKIGAVIGVLPIEIEQSLGIASWMAPSNSWTATLKNVTARPIVDSLITWVWLPHTHAMHSPCSSRSTMFLLIVVVFVMGGRTDIITADSVLLRPHVSLGTARRLHVKADACHGITLW